MRPRTSQDDGAERDTQLEELKGHVQVLEAAYGGGPHHREPASGKTA